MAVSVRDLPTVHALVTRRRVTRDEITAALAGSLPPVFDCAQRHGPAVAGPPFEAIVIPAGRGVVTIHRRPYDGLPESYRQVEWWVRDQGLSAPEATTAYVDSYVQDPERILTEAARTLDFSKPVALTMIGILGNVADYAEARSIVERLLAAVPSGSYLAVSDGTSTSAQSVESQRIANRSGHPYNLRTPEEIGGYFDGLELLEPGVVPTSQWRPQPGSDQATLDVYCAVGRKP